MKSLRLSGRVAIVTGAAQGIGHAIASEFFNQGASVALVDIKKELVQQFSKHLNSIDKGKTIAIKADVTKMDQIKKMIGLVIKNFKKIDILVNNAGVNSKGYIIDLPDDIWDKVLEINLKSVFLCSKKVLPFMIKQNYGKIINISSIAGKQGEAAGGVYAASKFGIIGFTQALALEVAKYNILVNAICPGLITTELGNFGVIEDAKLRGISPKEHRQYFIEKTAQGRLGKPSDVAKMAAFIASDDCNFSTGSAFNVSGGYIMY